MDEKKLAQLEKSLSRRKFLCDAGKFAAGAAVGISTIGLVGCSTNTAEPPKENDGEKPEAQQTAAPANQGLPEWPWPYKKLDPDKVAKRAYTYYRKGGCMYAVAGALIDEMAEVVGYPYNELPTNMYKYGGAGVAYWGTLCGSLNGASAVINMVTKDFGKIINELFTWYCEFPFPSDRYEEYCAHPGQVTTVSGSPLCHISVSKWANAAGKKIHSDEKADRCAKLSGDVAAKTVELLNAALVDGNFTPTAALNDKGEFEHCLSCHTGKESTLDNVIAKQNCLDCHDDHNK